MVGLAGRAHRIPGHRPHLALAAHAMSDRLLDPPGTPVAQLAEAIAAAIAAARERGMSAEAIIAKLTEAAAALCDDRT
jgi:hypothetical protein